MQYDQQILDAIRRIFRSLRESSRAAESKLGLSGARLLVLQSLKNETLSINELAAKTQTHQSSVSVVVARLEEQGFIKRRISSEDARRSEIALTVKGAALLKKKSPQLAQERLFGAIGGLTPQQRKQLATLLTDVVHRAGFDDQPATLFFED